jgi:hypothetical protein
MQDVNDEQNFIHDLASPLATSILISDSILAQLETLPGASTELIGLARKLQSNLGRVHLTLKTRRDAITANKKT